MELLVKIKIFLFVCFHFSLILKTFFSQVANWKQEQELMNIHT